MRQPGEVVAGFRIERLLGSGGMGEVYLVQHPRLHRQDALKLLPSAASADHSYRERFQREADLGAQLDHDNVVTIYDRGEADGQLWIHMKYVAGQDAAAALRTGGPFSTQRALHTITRVAAALDDAHRHGLIHRDVKPANILLGNPASPGEPERVYLTDFGIAKGAGDAAGLTPSGHFAASLDYAAPEQIRTLQLDGRADQYALGCVLFTLLTGSVPFTEGSPYDRMTAHLSAPIPRLGLLRPGLPLAVQSVIDRAMAKEPSARFESCGAMAAALADSLQGVTDVLPGPRSPDRSETPPPHPAPLRPVSVEPAPVEPGTGSAPPTEAFPPQPPVVVPENPWWLQADRSAVGVLVAALALGLVSAFPPSSALSASRYPGELGTGHFAAGQLPALLMLLVGVGLQLTRSGHRYRSLLYGVAAGAGVFAFIDSLRVYAFTRANPGGAYDSSLAQTNGALPRLFIALVIAAIALVAVLRTPPRPRPRPGPHTLVALMLAGCAFVLATVAIIVGPAIQASRIHQLVYGVPLGSALAAAALLAVAAMTRRPSMLVASVTVTFAALIAGLAAPDPLHYPIAIVADIFLLAAAAVLYTGSRRPMPDPPPAYPPHLPPPPESAWAPGVSEIKAVPSDPWARSAGR